MWYDDESIKNLSSEICGHCIPKKQLLEMKNNFKFGQQLYETLIKTQDNGKEMLNDFDKHILENGTFKDKVSCWLLKLQECSLTRLAYLDEMLKILKMDIKRHRVYMIPLIVELFLNMQPKYWQYDKNKNNRYNSDNKMSWRQQRKLINKSMKNVNKKGKEKGKGKRKGKRREENEELVKKEIKKSIQSRVQSEIKGKARVRRQKGLLPSDRYLLSFNQRIELISKDSSIINITQLDLIFWYFEHLLKKKYHEFVSMLENFSITTQVGKLRDECLKCLWKMLSHKQECDLQIINVFINKLGIGNKSMNGGNQASIAIDYLNNCCVKQPKYKSKIVQELHSYLLRPSVSPVGLHYGIFFLSKLRFTAMEYETANYVCGVYMDIFKILISYQDLFDILQQGQDKNKNKNQNKNQTKNTNKKNDKKSRQSNVVSGDNSNKNKQNEHGNEMHDEEKSLIKGNVFFKNEAEQAWAKSLLIVDESDGKIDTNNIGVNESTTTKDNRDRNFSKNFLKAGEYSSLSKLIGLTKKERSVIFKNNESECKLWKKFLQLSEMIPKLFCLVLRGISYVLPFGELSISSFKKDLDYVYKLASKSNMKIGVMAMQFAFGVETRMNENRQKMAVFGTNMTDETPRHVIKHENRFDWFQSSLSLSGSSHSPNESNMETPSNRYYCVLYNMMARWDFVIYSHPQTIFNLIYHSVRIDKNEARIGAFVNRLIEFSCCGSVSWTCGALYLVSSIVKHHSFLKKLLNNNNEMQFITKSNKNNIMNKREGYDMYNKQPEMSNGDKTPLWQLDTLCLHMHPAVRNFSKHLLVNNMIKYRGDPLKDFDKKVLFSKFVQLMAHQTKEFRPSVQNTNKNKNKNKKKADNDIVLTKLQQGKLKDKKRLLKSYLMGDEFIALYKEQSRVLPTKRPSKQDKLSKENRGRNDDDKSSEPDELDSDEEDEFVSKYIYQTYGNELPEDIADMDQLYDMSEFAKEVKQHYQRQDDIFADDDDGAVAGIENEDEGEGDEDENQDSLEDDDIDIYFPDLPQDMEFASDSDPDPEVSA